MKTATKCAMLSIVFSFPMSLVLALIYRFPIPMGGYIGPASDVGIDYSNILDILKMVSIAWVFYGIMGGFIVLAIGGAAASKLTFQKPSKTEHSQFKQLVVRAVCVSFLGCGALAILDFIIGPW